MSQQSAPSSIELNDESIKRKYESHESHESFGFRNEPNTGETMPDSPTPPLNTLNPPQSRQERDDLNKYSLSKDTQSSMNRILNSAELYSFSHAPQGDESQDIFLRTFGSTNLDGDTTDRGERQMSRIFNNIVRRTIPRPQRRPYSSEPPSGPHTEYIEHTGNFDDPMQRLTQVLIWTIARRISRLDRKAESMTTLQFFNLKRMLVNIQEKLEWQLLELTFNMHDLLRLKPQMANPMNEDNTKILERLTNYRQSLESENSLTQKLQIKAEARYLQDSTKREQPLHNTSSETADPANAQTDLYIEPLKQAFTMANDILETFLSEAIENDGRASQVAERLGSVIQRQENIADRLD